MKYILLCIAVLGIGIAVAVTTTAQQSGTMQGQGGMMGDGMMGGGMMGGQPSNAQVPGTVASIYTNRCVACHGVAGKGDGPAMAALSPKPKDFSDCKAMASVSDDALSKAVKGGGQSVGLSPIMPAWGGSLTDQQIHGLVAYIRSFCKK